ncbi:DHA2 family efflux MFS transporter permease subunit [Dactylosporangium darangshiense]|uniref:MDR family MFS transporter n=1 Tax=Dactylosporangium darangshiense TaxID=579108 RepID=A0ABP8D681_9ACTN
MRLGRLAAILIAGVIAPILDTTIVNVALGTLGRELRAPVADVQWVVTAYLLALAAAIPLTGWSVARFGGRRMWLVSLALFLGGSALCAAAWNIGALVAFRAVQGFGAGLMIPIMQTLLVQAAHGRPLGRLMATISLPALVGPIFGPVVGGLIVGHASWRWVFLVNVPVCVVALALAAWKLPAELDDRGEAYRLDVIGLALLSPGLAAGIYGLSQVANRGTAADARVLVPLAAFVVLLGAFGWHTRRTRAVPVVDLRLFRSRPFAAASALLFLAGLALFGAMLLLPLYYQQVRGASVVTAGLLLVPQGIGSLLVRPALGRFIDRIGPRAVVLAGVALTLAGTVPFALGWPEWALAAALVVRGGGLTGVLLAVMTAAYEGLERSAVPHASSATRIAQQVGGAFGAAVLAVILQHQGGSAAAFRHSFWWAAGFTLLAVAPALLLPARAPAASPAVTAPTAPLPAR